MFFSRQPDVKGTNISENQKKGRKSSSTESVVVDWRGEAGKSESAKNRLGSPRETLGGSFFFGLLVVLLFLSFTARSTSVRAFALTATPHRGA
jgi:hypothetical protein